MTINRVYNVPAGPSTSHNTQLLSSPLELQTKVHTKVRNNGLDSIVLKPPVPYSRTSTELVDLISVYTASRSRTEPMQCTNLTSRVVRAPFTLNPT